MILSILAELQPIAEELYRYMSPHALEHLTKEKGFVHCGFPFIIRQSLDNW